MGRIPVTREEESLYFSESKWGTAFSNGFLGSLDDAVFAAPCAFHEAKLWDACAGIRRSTPSPLPAILKPSDVVAPAQQLLRAAEWPIDVGAVLDKSDARKGPPQDKSAAWAAEWPPEPAADIARAEKAAAKAAAGTRR